MSEGRDIVDPVMWHPADDRREPVLDRIYDLLRVFAMPAGVPACCVVTSLSRVKMPAFESHERAVEAKHVQEISFTKKYALK